jgi:hypothetical protein
MERVAFLIEATGERLGCLLNPDGVVMRRWAGLRARRSAGTAVSGAGLADDRLLFTGGGGTELLLDLLFDVSIGGSTIRTEDVRDLTGPLWRLAENAEVVDGYGRPPLVRFVWGKAWNFPAVVAAVAERLEHFNESGAPRRSWLRMRLVRVAEASAPPRAAASLPLDGAAELAPGVPLEEEPVELHEVIGAGAKRGDTLPREPEHLLVGERGRGPGAPRGVASPQYLGQVAYDYAGDATAWRPIAEASDVVDPLALPGGTVLRIPLGKP